LKLRTRFNTIKNSLTLFENAFLLLGIKLDFHEPRHDTDTHITDTVQFSNFILDLSATGGAVANFPILSKSSFVKASMLFCKCNNCATALPPKISPAPVVSTAETESAQRGIDFLPSEHGIGARFSRKIKTPVAGFI
jgi:hypothetical protein